MVDYLKEPAFPHDYQPRVGVLLVNLGSPDAPTASALRRYLQEFLSDTRVIEVPKAIWWFILNGIILLTRPAKAAKRYAAIWQAEGAPLLINTRRQTELLANQLARRGHDDVLIRWAMRYGNPSIQSVLIQMRALHVERLLVVPLYPQYAAAASAAALDQVFRVVMRMRNMPEIRTVRHFYNFPGYINALASRVHAHWEQYNRAGKLIMSFHGIPQFARDKGDPYYDECHQTGRLLAQALGLAPADYIIAFQSRFGYAKWLSPYTSDVLIHLAKTSVSTVDVVCPGFVTDCLETLEEIAIEGKELFLANGGQQYRFISGLNDCVNWTEALADLVESQLGGWFSSREERIEQQ